MNAAAPSDVVQLSRTEYESVVEQLKDAVHITLHAWVTRDEAVDGLEVILERIHAIRLNLETCVIRASEERS